MNVSCVCRVCRGRNSEVLLILLPSLADMCLISARMLSCFHFRLELLLLLLLATVSVMEV